MPNSEPSASPLRRNTRKRTSAFTLIEILVALAILGMLAGIAFNAVEGIMSRAQVSAAKLAVSQSFSVALTSYRISMGDYPTTEEGLQALFVAPSNKADRWRGPYVSESQKYPILDPWGEPYQYRYPGSHNKKSYDIWSKGPDHTDGTDDDIGNW
jgi:general secretion pathway protein G